ncbi:MAG: hypothetical protein EHM33_21550 [Chloroflexi bacterium]|nr:MAG: hypothetical protein EHM33_21550 [Chloroflexota bacterium]
MTIDIDEARVERNEVGLWLGWTLATAGGLLLGFLPTVLVVNVFNLGLAQIIVPVLAGTIIGFSQWIVLRRYVTATSDWVLAGGTSWAVGYVLGLFLVQALPSTIFAGIIGYLLFGVIVALVQWPVLRREIPNAFVWVLASALGWAAGFWTSQAVLPLFFSGPLIEPALSTTVIAVTSGLVAGAITGVALIWIVRKPEVV